MRLTLDTSGARPAVDAEDFPALVAARGTQLHRTACLLTGGDTHLAEDLVQEALRPSSAASVHSRCAQTLARPRELLGADSRELAENSFTENSTNKGPR